MEGERRSLNLKYETDKEAQVSPLKGDLRVCIRGGNLTNHFSVMIGYVYKKKKSSKKKEKDY